ncbi:MAG TPA: 2-oxoglutarate dehydrogenase complex dihydrolipoyllysine-residue succinyltransferase [Gemmataceae bacterium]|jgi:2-oxoglutarate dehydrogenase E2 component (dihydrolipoamide succinyltransferase)|nr:2-oxoglutarate dehydrogenase complex dihydrolipoyllysine-residue succinyltransferase [Gemmataceae bacterium]
MALDIKIPSVGESITEGVLSRWFKKDGDEVHAGEPIFELETEKVTTEIPAPGSGVLKITVPAGQTIAIGSVVGRIEETVPGSAPVPSAGAKEAGKGVQAVVAKTPETKPSPPASSPVEVNLSPAARRLVGDLGMEVHGLKGTGRSGRITKGDILAKIEEQKGPADSQPLLQENQRDGAAGITAASSLLTTQQPIPARETRQRMTSIRQRIADRLLASQKTTATLTTFNEADMSAIMGLRGLYRDRFKEKHGVSLGFMSFFVKACVEALRAYPIINARIDGPDIVYHHYYHIGVAVSTDRGLMVPVLREADRLSFAQIEKTLAEMAARAREGKIAVTDLQGGTFTITNGGIFGSMLSTPILNPPQSAILGMHAIQNRPVAANDQVVIRPVMYLALSYDHRVIDGRDAVLFLVRVKECLENPERLFLEV